MKKYLNKYIIGISIVILLLCLVCQDETIENFMCTNCGRSVWNPFGKDERSCAECNNCGWCINESGEGSCAEGGSGGPLFRRDCVSWSTGQPQSLYTIRYPWYNPIGWWPYYGGWGGWRGPMRRRHRGGHRGGHHGGHGRGRGGRGRGGRGRGGRGRGGRGRGGRRRGGRGRGRGAP
tara:strand:+ start:1046 stop:1576 length:531 start_codon:yes stop_codon:yes gene_type:complete